MEEKTLIRHSKRLAKLLRHDPGALSMDPAGWVPVEELLALLGITRAQLDEVVAGNNKSRYAYDGTGTLIRASQGHTLPVDLGLEPVEPPEVLYHGTAEPTVDVVLAEGLRPMLRNHVHLSADVETATKVGSRHGRPVVLAVAATRMHGDGHQFYLSANGVWLCDQVPAEYLTSRAPD
ncbi:RNA 2'-phosphotransferase [Actinokineospora guangxiensis]|uniref:Probable RNA 2'-phosphotransferase n=1 Tax=Actinokineospora guangxiensis TaxID=1490288 RepID=A0ABW0EP21_9PSEU